MNWTIPVIFLVFILIFICVKTFSSGSNVNSSKNIIPGPRPLPIIGNLHIVNLQKLQQSLEEMSKKYGTIFSIHLGSKRMVVLSGYETVKDALVNHADEFAERPEVPIFRYIHNGFGVAFSHGDNWKMMRRFTLSTLRDFGMGRKTLEEKVAEESTFLIKDFESHKGNHFNFTVTLHLAIANIITSIVFGQRFEYDNPQLCRLSSLVKEIFRLLGNPMVLEKEDPNSYFHDGNLLSLLSALFMAGTDTISGTLRWGLLLMAVYPEIQSKVQEEIERVIEKAQPRTEHRKQMPYTDAVIHEIQRIANIVPLNLPRETTVDVTFKGYFIPKGTYIIPLLESVLRDETQFEKPNEFNPQRFLDTEGKFVKREAFMPFSAGRRICIGETLAKMELFIFFTSLIQKFTFFPPPGVTHVHIAPDTGFTAPPQYQRICAVPRF
ncbi:cytochrome P450 2K6-like isoform X2 [Rhinatrema bivittatum]|uniref:cytochrome P450 2K6-like isoform X2 n=1 Tax=Rhinatrema bivittatum TaxID=194408 RepID=UPI001126D6ED|nr:cytochrome P450 2K6-like isoform X2 [Rhinatrema bivittatum]